MITHSRGASTVRKPTLAVTARARARDAAKDRATEEKAERRQEIMRLKALKRKEVSEKLLKLIEAAGAGINSGEMEGLDLEGDWDEGEHDRQMAKVFAEEYDGVGEEEGFKPEWDDEIDIRDIQMMNGEEIDSNDEDDQEEEVEEEVIVPVKKSKRKRDTEGFPSELLEAAKLGGDLERKALLEQMVDEYYKLDYEDKVSPPFPSRSYSVELY